MTLEFMIHDDDGLIPPIDQVPMDSDGMKLNDRDDIFASAATAEVLTKLGDEIPVTEEDQVRAQELFESARTPTQHEKKLPAVMMHLNAMLTQYDHAIIEDAQQVRTYVTNRLIEESNDDDPKIRMRALELLGKVSDVALFTERKEITVKHQSDEELEDLILGKLDRLMGEPIDAVAEDISDAEIVDSLDPEDVFK
jgi:hypothetical protein